MLLRYFCVPYTEDKRMIYAKNFLEKKGFLSTDNTEYADFVLLPVPVKKHMLENLNGKLAFYGMGDYENGYDYMKNENYVLKNAVLTAEGAVSYLEENTPYSLVSKKILIVGYGRIAKALHKILSAYGAEITVCSRSEESRSLAVFNGAKHIFFEDLKSKNDFDIIINTVPHIVLTKQELSMVKKDAVILDLASFPGGLDTLVASSMGIKVLNGKAMPIRYTVETAGELIGEAVYNIIREELT